MRPFLGMRSWHYRVYVTGYSEATDDSRAGANSDRSDR